MSEATMVGASNEPGADRIIPRPPPAPRDVNMLYQLSNKISMVTTWNSSIEGRLLTFIDASFSDREQREAVKSIIRGIVRDHFIDVNERTQDLVNEFSDVFEGREVSYVSFNNPSGENDVRRMRERGVVRESSFNK